jgi:hypothetical protein
MNLQRLLLLKDLKKVKRGLAVSDDNMPAVVELIEVWSGLRPGFVADGRVSFCIVQPKSISIPTLPS